MGIKVTMAPKWTSLLSQEIEKDYFQALLSFLTEEYAKDHVVPSKDNVFKPFRLTDYDKVKVVIIGQDPYPGAGQANGLAFGVPDDFYPKPKTFGEIVKDRKSTRLNSSHVKISYAVCCLKKKIKK